MVRILALCGTAYGHPERIVRRIVGVLTDHRAAVTLVRGDCPPEGFAPDEYDAYLVAAPIMLGRHHRYVRRFVRRHAARLSAAPRLTATFAGAAAYTQYGFITRWLAAPAVRTGR